MLKIFSLIKRNFITASSNNFNQNNKFKKNFNKNSENQKNFNKNKPFNKSPANKQKFDNNRKKFDNKNKPFNKNFIKTDNFNKNKATNKFEKPLPLQDDHKPYTDDFNYFENSQYILTNFYNNYFHKKFQSKQRGFDVRFLKKLQKISINLKRAPYASTVEINPAQNFYKPFRENDFLIPFVKINNSKWRITTYLKKLETFKHAIVPILQQKLYEPSLNAKFHTNLKFLLHKKRKFFRRAFSKVYRPLNRNFITPTAYKYSKVLRKSENYFILTSKFFPFNANEGYMRETYDSKRTYIDYGLKRIIQKYETPIHIAKHQMFKDELDRMTEFSEFSELLKQWQLNVANYKIWLRNYLATNYQLLRKRFTQDNEVPINVSFERRFKRKKPASTVRLLKKPFFFKSFALDEAEKNFTLAQFLGLQPTFNQIITPKENKYQSTREKLIEANTNKLKVHEFSYQTLDNRNFSLTEKFLLYSKIFDTRLEPNYKSLSASPINKILVKSSLKVKNPSFKKKIQFLNFKENRKKSIKIFKNTYFLKNRLPALLSRNFCINLLSNFSRITQISKKQLPKYALDKLLQTSYKILKIHRSKLEPEAFPFMTLLGNSSKISSVIFMQYLNKYLETCKIRPYHSFLTVKYFNRFDSVTSNITHTYSQFNNLNDYGYLTYDKFLNTTAKNNLMTSYFPTLTFRSFFLINLSFKANNLFVTAYTNPKQPKPTNFNKSKIPDHIYFKYRRGSIIATASAGSAGFKGPKRTSTIAAYEAGKLLASKLISKKISQSIVIVKRFNDRILGSVLRGLADKKVGFKVLGLDYQYRVPHSPGLRAKKVRRV
jgi:ribosomal protein S11